MSVNKQLTSSIDEEKLTSDAGQKIIEEPAILEDTMVNLEVKEVDV